MDDSPVSDEPLETMRTSAILKELVALLKRGPIERGYSDKAYYNRHAAIFDEIDRRIPTPPEEI